MRIFHFHQKSSIVLRIVEKTMIHINLLLQRTILSLDTNIHRMVFLITASLVQGADYRRERGKRVCHFITHCFLPPVIGTGLP